MSVPPINPTDLAHSMGDPAAIGKHPMRAANDDEPPFSFKVEAICALMCVAIWGGTFLAIGRL